MTPKEIEALNKSLPDDYSRILLKGGLRVFNDRENPIRMNLFSAATRELFAHVLRYHAPADEVRDCDWFEQDRQTPGKVSRRQRAVYAMQGGLSDAYVTEGLGLDASDLHNDAIRAIEALNDATHVQEDKLETDAKVIDAFANGALKALVGLLQSFRDCREAVENALRDELYLAVMETFVEQTFDNLDLLSSHGYEGSSITTEKVAVKAIRATNIDVEIEGVAHVTLHYGRGDDAAEIDHDFSFLMTFTAPVSNPLRLELTGHAIDDSSWFGEEG